MRESEYYTAIEKLGKIVLESVKLACGRGRRVSASPANPVEHTNLSTLAAEADRTAGHLMRALASDFITPLGRGDLSSVALSLRRAVFAACAVSPVEFHFRTGLSDSCLALAETAESFSRLLRGLKKKKPIPSAAAYFGAARVNEKARTESQSAQSKTAQVQRLYDSLCDLCEALITAAMNNI